MPMDCVLFIK